MNRKLFIIFGFATLLAGGVFVWDQRETLATPVVNNSTKSNQERNENVPDISTWKTYQNNKYKYSIRYPKNWYIDSKSSDRNFSQRGLKEYGEIIGGDTYFSNYPEPLSYNVQNPAPEDFLSIALMVYQIDQEIDYQQFKYSHVDGTESSELIAVAGKTAYKIDRVNTDHPADIKTTSVLIKDKGMMFVLSYSHNQANQDTQEEIFRGLLESFQIEK